MDSFPWCRNQSITRGQPLTDVIQKPLMIRVVSASQIRWLRLLHNADVQNSTKCALKQPVCRRRMAVLLYLYDLQSVSEQHYGIGAQSVADNRLAGSVSPLPD